MEEEPLGFLPMWVAVTQVLIGAKAGKRTWQGERNFRPLEQGLLQGVPWARTHTQLKSEPVFTFCPVLQPKTGAKAILCP